MGFIIWAFLLSPLIYITQFQNSEKHPKSIATELSRKIIQGKCIFTLYIYIYMQQFVFELPG